MNFMLLEQLWHIIFQKFDPVVTGKPFWYVFRLMIHLESDFHQTSGLSFDLHGPSAAAVEFHDRLNQTAASVSCG